METVSARRQTFVPMPEPAAPEKTKRAAWSTPKGFGPLLRSAMAGLLSLGLVGVFALPANAITPEELLTPTSATQVLRTTGAEPVTAADVPLVEETPVVVAPPIENVLGARVPAGAVAQSSGAPADPGSLIAIARSQLGDAQDCTLLIERTLTALGYAVWDLGTLDAALFGVAVPAAEVRAGDIMMRGPNNGGHVAIYTGDGTNHVAIHGGFSGSTVETHHDASPSGYTHFVRIG